MSRLVPHYSKSRVGFLCCDLQKSFQPAIPNFAHCVFVANRFSKASTILPNTTFLATEQYPKGLGNTVPEVKMPEGAPVFAKTSFSMMTDDVTGVLLPDSGRSPASIEIAVLFGIEAHVCVLQTAADLVDSGVQVVLAYDGIGSQRGFDSMAAMNMFDRLGPKCSMSTSESILLQMVRDAKDPHFKEISNLLKEKPPTQ